MYRQRILQLILLQVHLIIIQIILIMTVQFMIIQQVHLQVCRLLPKLVPFAEEQENHFMIMLMLRDIPAVSLIHIARYATEPDMLIRTKFVHPAKELEAYNV